MSEAIERYLALWEKWAETGHDQTLKTEDLQCEMDKAWYAMTTEEIDSVNKELDARRDNGV